MKSKEFFDMVRDMRKAQKEYFATRSKDALQKSMNLERGIDAEIDRVTALGY